MWPRQRQCHGLPAGRRHHATADLEQPPHVPQRLAAPRALQRRGVQQGHVPRLQRAGHVDTGHALARLGIKAQGQGGRAAAAVSSSLAPKAPVCGLGGQASHRRCRHGQLHAPHVGRAAQGGSRRAPDRPPGLCQHAAPLPLQRLLRQCLRWLRRALLVDPCLRRVPPALRLLPLGAQERPACVGRLVPTLCQLALNHLLEGLAAHGAPERGDAHVALPGRLAVPGEFRLPTGGSDDSPRLPSPHPAGVDQLRVARSNHSADVTVAVPSWIKLLCEVCNDLRKQHALGHAAWRQVGGAVRQALLADRALAVQLHVLKVPELLRHVLQGAVSERTVYCVRPQVLRHKL
mmetsp:Transcript_16999/g.53214  ORF Transcript_16999/g.53214 Transcript_16999/m.53214 type:complete len:347 (+) Transcript_16999:592-1632(+)